MTSAAAPDPVSNSGRLWPSHAWIALPVRLYLGGVFLFACWHKIHAPAVFAVDVATYQLLPLSIVNLFSLVIPWIELISGLCFVTGVRVRAAALLMVAMMISFILALFWALHLGLDMSCGCFASQSAKNDPISALTVLRDLAWLALATYVMAVDKRPLGLPSLLSFWRKKHA
jgi:uncharacterized membrane protein YphA (DoxX/SURF4 family)